MPLTLYYDPYSQPSRTILTFLRLANVPYEPKVIELLKAEQKSPEFLKINPLGKLPTICDDDFLLSESEAIILYIIESRGVGKEYYPEDPEIRAQINQYFPYHHAMVRPKLSKLFNFVYFPTLMKGPKDGIRAGAYDLCKQFECLFLKENRKYITGDVFTIADIFATNELTQIYYAVQDFDWTEVPKLRAYVERCLENNVLSDANKQIQEFPELFTKMREKAAQDRKKLETF